MLLEIIMRFSLLFSGSFCFKIYEKGKNRFPCLNAILISFLPCPLSLVWALPIFAHNITVCTIVLYITLKCRLIVLCTQKIVCFFIIACALSIWQFKASTTTIYPLISSDLIRFSIAGFSFDLIGKTSRVVIRDNIAILHYIKVLNSFYK